MTQHPHINQFLKSHTTPVMKQAYLANPYYDPNQDVMRAREQATTRVAASLIHNGIPHISPVLYTSLLARMGAHPPRAGICGMPAYWPLPRGRSCSNSQVGNPAAKCSRSSTPPSDRYRVRPAGDDEMSYLF